jgi:acetylglutamate kinase
MPATVRNKPIMVIKLGGSMLHKLSPAFMYSLKELLKTNHLVVVHGGGPAINAMLDRLQISSEFVNGQRKTTSLVLEVVEMVLAGTMNKQLVKTLQQHELPAVGLSGCDGQLLTASYVNPETLGLVGKVECVNTHLLHALLKASYFPVIAPLGKTKEGQTVNINADLCAAAVAEHMQAEKLLFVTDVPGIFHGDTLIQTATSSMITSLLDQGVIYGGMVPKVTAAMSVLSTKLKEVMIVGGHHDILNDGQMVGTRITN